MSVVAGVGAFSLVSANADSPAQPEPPGLAIVEPSGEFQTGMTALHLIDEDRADVWVPEARRELMVSLWYPTDEDGLGAPYMTFEESSLFTDQLSAGLPEPLPDDLLSEVGTNSVPDAEPVADDGTLPLVVLSPGFSFPRATLTGIAEELAGRGYVVAAIGHNYEAPISFPDRTTECLACTDLDADTLVPNRAEDLSFVLDELTGGDAAWEDAGIIDTERIAVGGHSIGGASSHRAMLADDRFGAGFNLDGTFFALDPHKLDRPFLIVGADEHGRPGEDDTWTKAWKHLEGWKRWITADGTTHSSFTDLAPLGAQLGQQLQDMDGLYADQLTRDHIVAFADAHLRGAGAPILEGPNDVWPEIRFHHPRP